MAILEEASGSPTVVRAVVHPVRQNDAHGARGDRDPIILRVIPSDDDGFPAKVKGVGRVIDILGPYAIATCERRPKSAAGVGAAEKCGTLESGV